MSEENSKTSAISSQSSEVCYTPEQVKIINKINEMGHHEMCGLWRFGHPYYFTPPYGEIFKERLFQHFGGFTPSISKSIGWGD